MTDTCIVCLGDLRVAIKEEEGLVSLSNDDLKTGNAGRLPISANNESKQAEDDEIIANLSPCGHNLHNSCLKPWVERANSCPICRAQFNMVELRRYLDTPTYASYAVQEKQQEAEIDPTLIIDEDLFDLREPCIVCNKIDTAHEEMYCDGCERTVHVFCAGYEDSPEVWYCESCLKHLDNFTNPTTQRVAPNGTRRPRQGRRGRRLRHHMSEWDRVWQQVWNRLDLDLDFPFDDEPAEPRRTQAQLAELAAWQQRLQVANRQGGANGFRDTANTLLNQANDNEMEPSESREEVRAWNAFDKAKQLVVDERPPSRRKRKSMSSSPASMRDSDVAPERKLKRPRTRRNVQTGSVPDPGPSTSRPPQHDPEQPSFLKSLLQEVEKQPVASEMSDGDEHSVDEQQSSYLLSPASSPLHSGHVSPRVASVTPPPQTRPRPSSPTPLTSTVRPILSSPPFSPFSPSSPAANDIERRRSRLRQPQPASAQPSSPVSPASPSRNMSYSTKTEIQRMVKAVLRPLFNADQIDKDQYTDINRDVSRLMYKKVGDAEALADQAERDKWQQFAHDEVERVVETIRSQQQHGEANVALPDIAGIGS
ncbi:hypothetical protein BDV97DRAFT_372882 [Delphinella strobiligena]|nr:hypothetical protein BDV97DRAFT_372882 [Delphinella strobiligena]